MLLNDNNSILLAQLKYLLLNINNYKTTKKSLLFQLKFQSNKTYFLWRTIFSYHNKYFSITSIRLGASRGGGSVSSALFKFSRKKCKVFYKLRLLMSIANAFGLPVGMQLQLHSLIAKDSVFNKWECPGTTTWSGIPYGQVDES